MAWGKRKPRCGYCWGEGHNRNSCPKVKQEAANGDAYAQRTLENSKIRRCSFCGETDHTRAKCVKEFDKTVVLAKIQWLGMRAVASICEKNKIAKGAFCVGPLLYRGESVFMTENQNVYWKERTFEIGNFVIEEIKVDHSNYHRPDTQMIKVSTLSEPENQAKRFSKTMPLAHFANEIKAIATEEELKIIENDDRYSYSLHSDSNLNDNFEVIEPASDEDVEKLVKSINDLKPEILKYDMPEKYWAAKRAERKANKQAQENKEENVLSELLR